jgi:hypothetical protein
MYFCSVIKLRFSQKFVITIIQKPPQQVNILREFSQKFAKNLNKTLHLKQDNNCMEDNNNYCTSLECYSKGNPSSLAWHSYHRRQSFREASCDKQAAEAEPCAVHYNVLRHE